MTTESAHAVSTAILVTAGVAAAYVVLTTPPLRRLAFMGVRLWLGSSVPVYLITQVGRAWAEAGNAQRL